MRDRPWSVLLGPGIFAVGALGWGVVNARLQRRCLHMLQIEGYQTARFLRWWARRPARIVRPRLVALSCAGLAFAFGSAIGPRAYRLASEACWAALGLWLVCLTRYPAAKKPLAMTARARRLVLGEAATSIALALVVQRRLSGRSGASMLLALAALAAPTITGIANLLLFPVEEALRQYYQRGAARKLSRLGTTVVAVAGSYGKTSTKEFLATILESRFEVLRPPASHNTPMGISRVIREQLEQRHEIFVAELGDWVPGDIALLCRLLRPTVGVVTSIGPEHLERFRTMARVEASKLELLEALPPDGTAVINQDDDAVRSLGDRTPAAKVVRFGMTAEGTQVRARDIRTTRDGLDFAVEVDAGDQVRFKVGVFGRHNVSNLLAAISAALALGMSLQQIAIAARQIQPVEHRLQPIQGAGGVLIIDDAFNSNPRGAAAALDVLAELDSSASSRRILVTPGMVELAEREFEENRCFGRRAAKVCDTVIVVGQERAAPLVAGLRDEGFPEEQLHVVGDLAGATARLGGLVRAGDVVLFENDLPDTYADAP